jgi:hypothetical protein
MLAAFDFMGRFKQVGAFVLRETLFEEFRAKTQRREEYREQA